MRRAMLARVLFVRLGAIGDVANALLVATALKDRHPNAFCGWAVHDQARPLVQGHPAVDRVHVWPRAAGWTGFMALVREVRAARYDTACDLQRLAKSALLARLSGAGRVVGFDRRRSKELSWLLVRERIGPASGPHRVDGYLDFARHLGLDAEPPRFLLPERPEAARAAEALVRELGAAPVLLNLGATKPANRWRPDRFGLLAGRLATATTAPIAFVGAQADEPAAVRAMAAARPRQRIRNLVGQTSLPELWELLRRATVLVTGDTGPMHLAAAVGTPCVALFGASDPSATGPWGPGHRVVTGSLPPCAPCERRTCHRARHDCMDDLEVERVLAEVLELLRAGGRTGPPAP